MHDQSLKKRKWPTCFNKYNILYRHSNSHNYGGNMNAKKKLFFSLFHHVHFDFLFAVTSNIKILLKKKTEICFEIFSSNSLTIRTTKKVDYVYQTSSIYQFSRFETDCIQWMSTFIMDNVTYIYTTSCLIIIIHSTIHHCYRLLIVSIKSFIK